MATQRGHRAVLQTKGGKFEDSADRASTAVTSIRDNLKSTSVADSVLEEIVDLCCNGPFDFVSRKDGGWIQFIDETTVRACMLRIAETSRELLLDAFKKMPQDACGLKPRDLVNTYIASPMRDTLIGLDKLYVRNDEGAVCIFEPWQWAEFVDYVMVDAHSVGIVEIAKKYFGKATASPKKPRFAAGSAMAARGLARVTAIAKAEEVTRVTEVQAGNSVVAQNKSTGVPDSVRGKQPTAKVVRTPTGPGKHLADVTVKRCAVEPLPRNTPEVKASKPKRRKKAVPVRLDGIVNSPVMKQKQEIFVPLEVSAFRLNTTLSGRPNGKTYVIDSDAKIVVDGNARGHAFLVSLSGVGRTAYACLSTSPVGSISTPEWPHNMWAVVDTGMFVLYDVTTIGSTGQMIKDCYNMILNMLSHTMAMNMIARCYKVNDKIKSVALTFPGLQISDDVQVLMSMLFSVISAQHGGSGANTNYAKINIAGPQYRKTRSGNLEAPRVCLASGKQRWLMIDGTMSGVKAVHAKFTGGDSQPRVSAGIAHSVTMFSEEISIDTESSKFAPHLCRQALQLIVRLCPSSEATEFIVASLSATSINGLTSIGAVPFLFVSARNAEVPTKGVPTRYLVYQHTESVIRCFISSSNVLTELTPIKTDADFKQALLDFRDQGVTHGDPDNANIS